MSRTLTPRPSTPRSMRTIWNDELAAMFTDPVDIQVIERALEAGDPDVLRQMFS